MTYGRFQYHIVLVVASWCLGGVHFYYKYDDKYSWRPLIRFRFSVCLYIRNALINSRIHYNTHINKDTFTIFR